MSRLNFHHLHYFWAVAKEGHLTRAAARLHVSQSAKPGSTSSRPSRRSATSGRGLGWAERMSRRRDHERRKRGVEHRNDSPSTLSQARVFDKSRNNYCRAN